MPNNQTLNNKRRLLTRFKRRAKYYYLKLLRMDDPPERIARGTAIGVLMGVLPTFGLGMIFAFVLAFVFKANKAAAVIGSMIMNPLTSAFFWSASAILGAALLGEDHRDILKTIREEGLAMGVGWAYVVFLVGNSIVSSVTTIISYFAVKKGVISHREHKRARRQKKREQEGYG